MAAFVKEGRKNAGNIRESMMQIAEARMRGEKTDFDSQFTVIEIKKYKKSHIDK